MSGPEIDRMGRLADTFVRLADSLVKGFDVVELLDFLVEECVQIADLAAAGIMLSDSQGELKVLAASSETTWVLELFELQHHQGPCLDCFNSGDALFIDDIDEQARRWPDIEPEFRRRGFGGVYALPMRLRHQTVGALNLFALEGTQMSEDDRHLSQAMADVATIALLQHRAIDAGLALTAQLQAALNSRIAIEQAKGVIAESAQVEVGAAFEMLQAYSRSSHRPLSEVARAVAAGKIRADEIANAPGGAAH